MKMPKSEGCGKPTGNDCVFGACRKGNLCPECQSQQEQENKVGLATGDSANLSPAGTQSHQRLDGNVPADEHSGGTDSLKSKLYSNYGIHKMCAIQAEKEIKDFIRQLKEDLKIRWDKGNFVLWDVEEELDKLGGFSDV